MDVTREALPVAWHAPTCGAIRRIRDACFEGMTVGETAELLGVNRVTLSRVINGHGAISPEMALKMERAGWGTAAGWIRRQGNYDLAQARRRMENVA